VFRADGRTDRNRHRDMTQLTVAVRGFAKTPNNPIS
jgi:hypothetical protein